MQIELGNYVIEGSELIGKYSKFNIYKLYTVKEGKLAGKVIKKPLWYHTTLEKCLNTIAQSEMKAIGKVDMETYLKEYERVSNLIKEYCATISEKFKELVALNESRA